MRCRSVPTLVAAFVAATACESVPAASQAGPATDGRAAPSAVAPEHPEVAEVAPGTRSEHAGVAITATGLPLMLLATLTGEDPRATIRDDEAGTIATYREGEFVRPEVVLASIERHSVRLEEGGASTELGFASSPPELSADDVFYPDLARYDDLPHSMADAVQLDDGEGYVVKAPAFAWGTPRSVAAIKEALRHYARAQPGAPPVYVGDLSKKDGGPFPPHVSHQSGRDVDIGLVHTGQHAGARRFVTASRQNLDFERTWALLDALLDTGQVAYVFVDYQVQGMLYEWAAARGINPSTLDQWFQYPHGRRAAHGLIRHWRGHEDHLHVRFSQ